jgi:3-mercaptopyruvate sulfurtransferase SseA
MFLAIEKMQGDTGISDDKKIIIHGNAADLYENAVTYWILELLGYSSPELSFSCTILRRY